MTDPIPRDIAGLPNLPTASLQKRFRELFDEASPSRNRTWLIKRIAWRLQERAEGGLSERAKRRALELADEADLRILPPRSPLGSTSPDLRSPSPEANRDRRLPPVGTVLARTYKGQTHHVLIHASDFEYAGERFDSLSAIANRISGSHINGFRFFQLTGASS